MFYEYTHDMTDLPDPAEKIYQYLLGILKSSWLLLTPLP